MSFINLGNYFKKQSEVDKLADQELGSADAELHAELVAFFALKLKDSQKVSVQNSGFNSLGE